MDTKRIDNNIKESKQKINEIDNMLNIEKKKIKTLEEMKETVYELNKNLNTCISLLSKSIKGKTADIIFNDMENANRRIYMKNNNLLEEGTNELTNGTNELYNGTVSFNNNGILKISNILNNKLKSKTDTLNNLVSLSKEYNSFTMKDKNTKGTTKFIYLIDGLKK